MRLNLLKVFKKRISNRFSGFGVYLIFWTCLRQLAWRAAQENSWSDRICKLRSPQLSPVVSGKSNQLGAHFLAYLRCFHRPQKSFSHPIPRGAFGCWHFSQLTVTRKLNTGWGHSAPQEQIRGLSLLIGLHSMSYTGSLRLEQIENNKDNTDQWLTGVYSCREFLCFIKFPAEVWAESNLRCEWLKIEFHLWMETGMWKLEPSPRWSWAHSSSEVESISTFKRRSSYAVGFGMSWSRGRMRECP